MLFGEGLVNDGIAILLYSTISNYELNNPNQLGWGSLWAISKKFVGNLFASISIGLTFGLTISYITKRMRFIAQNVIVETMLIFVFALGSYFVSNILLRQGIVSLLVTSIVMSHYAWHNLSP